MRDCKQKFDNFVNAVERLQEGILKFNEKNDLLRDGLIQRFEFTFELAWKTLKVIFEDEGLKGINSPKMVFKEAFLADLIEDEELWLRMLSDRNATSHIYSQDLAIKICNNIIKKYVIALESLKKKIYDRRFA